MPDACMSDSCFGHQVPSIEEAFGRLYEILASLLSKEQLEALAAELGVDAEAPPSSVSTPELQEIFPRIMLSVSLALTLETLEQFLTEALPEDLAAQSFALGDAGRRVFLGGLDDERVRRILDHMPDWVLLETGRRALEGYPRYTATLRKEERVEGKIAGVEVISLKNRESPRAFFLHWLDGPNKGRRVLYNEAVLGPGRIRVRERGLLGLAAVTIDVDSALAKRGTNHLATEIGLASLVSMLVKDYAVAAPRGHIRRVNHGLVTVDGQRGYRLESVLPRDPSLGYYAHRVIHDMDYLQGYPFRVEVYDFDDRLKERYHYQNVDPSAPLTDRDFDPKNRELKL